MEALSNFQRRRVQTRPSVSAARISLQATLLLFLGLVAKFHCAALADPCPAGLGRAAGYGSDKCNTCPQGTWSDGQQDACQSCPRGSFTLTSGATSAAQCTCLQGYVQQGSSSSSSSRQQCVPVCAEDSYLDVGSLICVVCPEGTGSAAGAVGRQSCRAPVTAQSTANSCKLGFGQRPGRAAGTCSKCPAGYFSPGGVGAQCKKCPSHTRARAGASFCKCAPGYARTKGQKCTRCPRATYSDPDGVTCLPCGAFLDAPEGSPDISFCECAAGFGTTAASPNSCAACPVGTYSPGLLSTRAQAVGGSAESSSDTVLGPKLTACISCGGNMTTKLTQSISRDECISTAGSEAQTCGLSKTVAITCVLDSLNEIFDIGFQNEDGFLRMTCAFPARPDVVIVTHRLEAGDSIQSVQACYNREGIVRAEFVGSKGTITCGKRKPPDAALTCVDFGTAGGPSMVGIKGFCSPETRALIGVQEVCFEPGVTSLGVQVKKQSSNNQR